MQEQLDSDGNLIAWIIEPGEPPTIADAWSQVWATYRRTPPQAQRVFPTLEMAQAELAYLQDLDIAGLFDRNTRQIINRDPVPMQPAEEVPDAGNQT